MRTKIFHPEHKKFKPIFKRKPNRNQKKNLKIQTQTQPQTETKFSKTKSISNRKLKLKSQNQTETLTRNFKIKSKVQKKSNLKENKLSRNQIEIKTNFFVTHDILCYNQLDKLEFVEVIN
jgi:hypothetical protein